MIIDTEQVKYFLENTSMTMYSLSNELNINRTTLSNLKNDPNLVDTARLDTIAAIQNFINKGEWIMKTQQDLVKKEIEDYLENYGSTQSTEMDEKFHMFETDVASLAIDVDNGDAFIYTRYEWLEYLEEKVNEADEEDKEYFEDRIEEFKGYNFDVLIDNAGSDTQYTI